MLLVMPASYADVTACVLSAVISGAADPCLLLAGEGVRREPDECTGVWYLPVAAITAPLV
ncbi:hypothetical protein CWT12_07335 [Actinomyces sp. 432]|nr:hypothetical protein CWT12_07335 [Actinomyces sp. 432]